MTSALDVAGLTYRYHGGFALEDVAFSVPSGRFTVLLGPNGAGKTTLVCLLSRLFTPSGGDIRVAGRSLSTDPSAGLSKLGVVFQQPSLDLDLTVAENLRYGASLHGLAGKPARARIDEELGRWGLADRREQTVRSLSGGYRRRIEVARALLHRPSVLVCDEATVGLDLPTREMLLAHLRSLCVDRGLAVLWTTHLVEEVHGGDGVVVIHGGRVRSAGIADALMRETGSPDMTATFHALTDAAAP